MNTYLQNETFAELEKGGIVLWVTPEGNIVHSMIDGLPYAERLKENVESPVQITRCWVHNDLPIPNGWVFR